MAIVKPFRALRPKPGLAAQICELPYDALSTEEARQVAINRPHSFFRVSKPEIDLPAKTSPDNAAVYAKGRENFDRLLRDDLLIQDKTARYFLYRQIRGRHKQTGLVAVSSCAEYNSGLIKKHELTRPEKEEDRVRHIEALDAQTGPVFLVYPADAELDALFQKIAESIPAIDFASSDGVRHSAWIIQNPEDAQFIEAQFATMPNTYIADGHHRSAAAAAVARRRKGANHSNFFLTVLFPHNQIQILPYNRFVHDLNGWEPTAFLKKIWQTASVAESTTAVEPKTKHQLGMYLAGRWHQLEFRPETSPTKNPAALLDAAILQHRVLQPLLAVENPRKSRRISFIGGIRGTKELEQLADKTGNGVAFSMHPLRIADLIAVADQGGVLPPKSTWFEPKLRDGMFCHLLRKTPSRRTFLQTKSRQK